MAAHGREGLKRFGEQAFDLVITDIVMPEIEGIETIISLRRRSPDLRIIAISGGGRGDARDYLKVARKLGAAQTLQKPFSGMQLADAVASALGAAPPPRP